MAFKLKSSSPLRIEVVDPKKAFAKELDRQTAARNAKTAAKNAKTAADNKSSYKKKADQYRLDVTTLSKPNKSQEGGRAVFATGESSASSKKARIKKFETNLFNNDKKNKPGSTEGYTASEYAIAKTSGRYKSNKSTKKTTSQATLDGKAGRDADDKARRNKTGIYASKTTKTPKVTKTRKKVVSITEANKDGVKGISAKGKDKDIVKSGKNIGKEKKNVKPEKVAKVTKVKISEPKKQVKSTRLSKRTEKTRAKGEAALASGDKKKALRLRRRVDRQEARGAKREVRGAKREAIKKINSKKTIKVAEPKKTVEVEKSKEKKKKTARSGRMM